MIVSEVEGVCSACSYSEGLDIVISVPDGERLARKTFNPRLE
jgi:cobalt-precorrin-5B (C1)-methyltransferase